MFTAPPGYQPIYNPDIPYTGPINGGLRAGMSLYIQGGVPHDINRFEIDLQCGDYEGCDIALHFNPRFDGWDKVVFNTFQNGEWEEQEKIHDMPFSKGEAFEMVIMVNDEGYQITVNGNQFYMYKHRMPFDRVRALRIAGDVGIQTINVIGGMQGGMGGGGYPGGMGGGNMGQMGGGYPGGMGGGYPGGGSGGYPGGGSGGYPGGGSSGNPGEGSGGYPGAGGGGIYAGGNLPVMGLQPIFNPPIPYSDMIPGAMSPKRTIIIRGMVPYGANQFSINFMVGFSRDIAFHMNPRVRDGDIVRNCCIAGDWGSEEREFNFNPFQEGQYFEISIRCGNQRFKVFVNGQHLFNFNHRFQPFTQIDMLEIEGDVQLSYIHF
ncbi:galectin-6-like [Engraulis encrasicolus]|uniref:galectin-6-like n=1 Tax=Engraulis encrasicolus TaxID=184585 RepID=UPI002FD63204